MTEFTVTYDEVADVLYARLGDSQCATNEVDDYAGILYRTSIETGKPCGVTVLDIKYTYGRVGGDVVCFHIQNFLKEVTLEEVTAKVYSILGYKIIKET